MKVFKEEEMKKKVIIGELNFELTTPENEENQARFEIENNASMVFERVELESALELRNLLDDFITECEKRDLLENQGPTHEFYSA